MEQKALECFFNVGPSASARIMAKYSIFPLAKVSSLSAKTVTQLTAELSGMTIEHDAKKVVNDNIKRLMDMNCHRGRRHAMGLPVRGQCTRSGQILTARKLNRVERFR